MWCWVRRTHFFGNGAHVGFTPAVLSKVHSLKLGALMGSLDTGSLEQTRARGNPFFPIKLSSRRRLPFSR